MLKSHALKVPFSQCQRAVFTPELAINEEQLVLEQEQYRQLSQFSEVILLRPLDKGFYEVISGWHLVVVCQQMRELIPAQVIQCDDAQALKIGLRDFSKRHQCHRLYIARALAATKQAWNWNDKQLAEAMGEGFSRASVTNHLRLLKLTPQAQARYLAEHFQHSVAKLLAGKSPTEQTAILSRYGGQSKIRIHQLQPKKYKDQSEHETATEQPKTRDQLRLEADISEKIGAPCQMTTATNSGGDFLEMQFFSMSELANITEKLQSLMSDQNTCKGTVRLRFDSREEINDFIDTLYPEEEF